MKAAKMTKGEKADLRKHIIGRLESYGRYNNRNSSFKERAMPPDLVKAAARIKAFEDAERSRKEAHDSAAETELRALYRLLYTTPTTDIREVLVAVEKFEKAWVKK